MATDCSAVIDGGQVAQPCGFALTAPYVGLSRIRLFPKGTPKQTSRHTGVGDPRVGKGKSWSAALKLATARRAWHLFGDGTTPAGGINSVEDKASCTPQVRQTGGKEEGCWDAVQSRVPVFSCRRRGCSACGHDFQEIDAGLCAGGIAGPRLSSSQPAFGEGEE
jgi:hypothetical protein